jgi:nicotinamide mononucleotide adenylyltransferase
MEQYIPDTYHKKRIPTCICRGVRYVLFHSDHSITRRGFQLTYAGVSGMYCFILITVSQERDSNLHMQECQVCTVSLSPSSDTVIRMEQYIPDTPAYVSWNPLLVILSSEWNSTYLTPVLFHSDDSITRRGLKFACAGVSGMYCFILIIVSQEGDSNLYMQGCQASDTVIRMEQYIPDTPAYLSWNPLLVILWSEWNSTYLTPQYH